MIKHWEHTEYVDSEQFHLFSQLNTPIKPSSDVPYNTAVFVSYNGTRLEGIHDPAVKGIRQLHPSARGSKSPNRDLRLYLDALHNPNITLLAVDGLMGTAKTSTVLEWVVNAHLKQVKPNMAKDGLDPIKKGETKVIVAKPHINAGGESYGHLPGTIGEKLDPTLVNFIQYFDRFHQAGYKMLKDSGYLEVLPLGFVRGMDAENVVLIADESQNTKELVTLASRKAKNARIFFLGDTSPYQIDRPGNTPTKNGLTDLVDLLHGAPYFQYIEMKTLEHIVRSDEVRDLVRRLFKKHGQDPKSWGC